ncbi:MAG: hypothetical protein ACI8Q1_003330, partial [Parvicella sp.]
ELMQDSENFKPNLKETKGFFNRMKEHFS